MKLFRTIYKVRPAVHHPRYYEWQFGFLSVWLFATDFADAGDRANAILEQLPYEIAGENSKTWRVVLGSNTNPGSIAGNGPVIPSEKIVDRIADVANGALHTGLALYLEAVATGADEPAAFDH